MLDDFIRFIKEKHLLSKDHRLLIAFSGGIDSVVLAELFHRAGYTFSLAHVNFNLRGEESVRDEIFAKKTAKKYQAEIYIKNVDTADYAEKSKVSIQVAARDIRYRYFHELCLKHGYDYVATAHHLDDTIETYLINLARGTGIAGLHGIPVMQGSVIRPLLFAWRKDIESFARDNSLGFVVDSSNQSIKYTRNRIRHKIIPELEKINPGFKANLIETIQRIREVEEIYNKAILETRNRIFEPKGDSISIPVDSFLELDPLEAYAFGLLSPFGFTNGQIKDIIGLSDSIPGKIIDSASHRLSRERASLYITPIGYFKTDESKKIRFSELESGIRTPVHLKFQILKVKPESFRNQTDTAFIDLDKLKFPLVLRKWRRGDRFIPLGMKGMKKLSDYFTDEKYTSLDKLNQWLLCSGNDIVWIIGRRLDDRFKVGEYTCKVLKINVELE